MALSFPIEMIVEGTPVSLQAKPSRRKPWQDRVRAACRQHLPPGVPPSGGRMAVKIFYFPQETMQGDLDNIIKPILDALMPLVYVDDRQVERIHAQKFELGMSFRFRDPSAKLLSAMLGPKPNLYIEISDDPAAQGQ